MKHIRRWTAVLLLACALTALLPGAASAELDPGARDMMAAKTDALAALMETLAKGGWQGKFGLGIVQWTGARTAKLVECYRRHAGGASTITKAQVIAAENEMILNDLKGSYSSVYTAWKKANSGALACEAAARSAGALVCTRYEIPVDKESKAVTRGNKAASIYKTMIGG